MPAARVPSRSRYDAVVVGGGHNGLVAAAYLARAGQSVLVLERLDAPGGAAVSAEPFTGLDARLSRYSYLVSLMPHAIVRELGLRVELRRRRISSYTPVVRDGKPTGLLVDTADEERTRASFRALTGSDREYDAWRAFYEPLRRMAGRVFPTLTGPLPDRAELRRLVGDDKVWEMLFERPLGEALEESFTDDTVRGVVLTDALIGTFTHAHDPSLKQNRCFLYHAIGNGTGDWDVPVGGMGSVTAALAEAARAAGAEIVVGHEVTAIGTDGTSGAEVSFRGGDREGTVAAANVLVNAAPHTLAGLLGRTPPTPAPEGAQLKVNLLLRRLPKLRDASADPRDAFSGTFHIAESYRELETAYREAAAGQVPQAPPSEIYCHSLTDPSILGPGPASHGFHTLTLFGLHMPARLFSGADAAAVKEAALKATLAQLDDVLGEPLADCLALDAEGRPCLEAKTPPDLEREVGLPGGHIFHRDLSFPYADPEGGPATDPGTPAGRWGVGTGLDTVVLCGAGAVRGGGVSGIPGHNAAMAVLERTAGRAGRG